MNYKLCLLAIICVSLFVSCSKNSQSKSNEIVIDDRPKTAAKNEIVIDDEAFKDGQEISSTSQTGSPRPTKIVAADRSEIDISYDGFGNKTETRCFNDHLRLQCVMLRTAADGQKKVFVYAQNGEVKKSLPPEMLDKVITAPADEIANAAGFYKTVQRSAFVVQNLPPKNNAPLQPLPSYNFPVQKPQIEQTEVPEIEPVASPTDKKPDKLPDNEQ